MYFTFKTVEYMFCFALFFALMSYFFWFSLMMFQAFQQLTGVFNLKKNKYNIMVNTSL